MTTTLTVGQRKIAAAGRCAAAYWAAALAGATPGVIPVDHPAAPRTGRAEALATVAADEALARRLDAVSRGDDHALHTLLTAATVALVRVYQGGDDLTVGQPPTGAAPLARVLPVRAPVAAADTFRSLLGTVGSVTRDVLRHQDYPVD
ncbi:MAG TPA: hypothetical protein VNV66_14750, partial [Pilimelia sp.]|nr:hypothetical protein [Pilimelia sp.]